MTNYTFPNATVRATTQHSDFDTLTIGSGTFTIYIGSNNPVIITVDAGTTLSYGGINASQGISTISTVSSNEGTDYELQTQTNNLNAWQTYKESSEFKHKDSPDTYCGFEPGFINARGKLGLF